MPLTRKTAAASTSFDVDKAADHLEILLKYANHFSWQKAFAQIPVLLSVIPQLKLAVTLYRNTLLSVQEGLRDGALTRQEASKELFSANGSLHDRFAVDVDTEHGKDMLREVNAQDRNVLHGAHSSFQVGDTCRGSIPPTLHPATQWWRHSHSLFGAANKLRVKQDEDLRIVESPTPFRHGESSMPCQRLTETHPGDRRDIRDSYSRIALAAQLLHRHASISTGPALHSTPNIPALSKPQETIGPLPTTT